MGRVLAREVVRFRDRAETAHRLAVLFDEETSDAELPPQRPDGCTGRRAVAEAALRGAGDDTRQDPVG